MVVPALRVGIFVLVMMSSVCFGQTASDFWTVNLRFQEIRTEMSSLMEDNEDFFELYMQQQILSGADNYRVKTRSLMVYLQLLSFVTETSSVADARLGISQVLMEDIPLDKMLVGLFGKMEKTPYGESVQLLSGEMSRTIQEMVKLEEGLLARLQDVSKTYDWIGE